MYEYTDDGYLKITCNHADGEVMCGASAQFLGWTEGEARAVCKSNGWIFTEGKEVYCPNHDVPNGAVVDYRNKW